MDKINEPMPEAVEIVGFTEQAEKNANLAPNIIKNNKGNSRHCKKKKFNMCRLEDGTGSDKKRDDNSDFCPRKWEVNSEKI